jgi:hypothetical protein
MIIAFVCQPFYTSTPTSIMDEQFVQEVKKISQEIVEKEFPKEKENFDSLFNLIISRLQEMGPGKEAEFLRKMQAEHPSTPKRTTVIITAVFEVLARHTYYEIDGDDNGIDSDDIRRILEKMVENKDQEEFSEVPHILLRNIKKAKEKAKKD